MVISMPVADGTGRDRGQLILIGAIAISIILVGLVVVVNTAMFTGVVGTEGTVETSKEAGVAADELSRSVSAVVHQENLAEGPSSDTDIDDDVAELQPNLLQASLDGPGSYVSVEYNDENQPGTRVIQNEYGTFESASGLDDWAPVLDGDIGSFVLIVDVAASSGGDDFEIYAHGNAGAGENRSLSIDVDSSNGEVTLETPDTACDQIEATDDTVRIDVANGHVAEDSSCSFDLFGPPEPGYTVTFLNGDEAEGRYWFVTDELSLNPTFSSDYDDDQPTANDAVWSYDLEYTYDIDEVTHTGDREVKVYA